MRLDRPNGPETGPEAEADSRQRGLSALPEAQEPLLPRGRARRDGGDAQARGRPTKTVRSRRDQGVKSFAVCAGFAGSNKIQSFVRPSTFHIKSLSGEP